MARLILKDGKSVKDLGRTIYALSQDNFNGGLERKIKEDFFETESQNADGTTSSITIKIVYDTKDTVHIVIPYYEKGGEGLEEAGAESTGLISVSGCGK